MGEEEQTPTTLLLLLAVPSHFAALGLGDAWEAARSLLSRGTPKRCHQGFDASGCTRGWGMVSLEDSTNMLVLQEEGRKRSFFSG